MTDKEMYVMIEDMRKDLEFIRDADKEPLNPADAALLHHAWKWARREYVPAGTASNNQSVRFYAGCADRIARKIRERRSD